MNILSIDTSGDCSSISSKIGDDLLSFQISHQRKERPDWENFLNHIGIFSNEDIKEFDLLVFGRGPGSYTAIRSSATFLKAISHTNKIPLMAVSNMESLAYKYFLNNKTTDDISVLTNSDIEDEFFYDIFLQKIRPLLTKRYTVDRIYANGTTYGQHGSLHQDSLNPDDRTFLIYMNAVSGTYFEGYGIHTPEENSALMFPGYIPHHSIGPPESFDDLRVTIAYKLLCK